MIDLQDKSLRPDLEEIGKYIRNPVFTEFCQEINNTYNCNEKIEYSGCSLEKGWNIKFKKSGKNLCTIYPRCLLGAGMVEYFYLKTERGAYHVMKKNTVRGRRACAR